MRQPPVSSVERSVGWSAIRIVILYAIFGGLWILLSDRLLSLIIHPGVGEEWVLWQTAKGWAFIAATAILLYVLIHQAIAAIHASEASRRRVEVKYQHLLNSSMLAIATWKFSGEITGANDELLRLMGYTREDLQQGRMRWTEMTSPEYRTRDEQALRELREWGLFRPFEKEFIRKDGSRVPVLVGGVCTDRECEEGVSFVLDVTERKQTEAALRESEARFRAVFDESAIGIAVLDCNGVLVSANRALEELLGYSRDELKGMSIFELTSPEDRAETEKRFRDLVEGRWTHTLMEKRYVRKDGRVVWAKRTASAIRDGSGAIRYLAVMIEDITDRKRAQADSDRRRKQLEILSRTSRQINTVLDREVILRTLVASGIELVDARGGAAGPVVDGRVAISEYKMDGEWQKTSHEPERGPAVPGWVLQTGQTYITNDAEHDAQVTPAVRAAMGFRSLIAVPICGRAGQILACLGIFDKNTGQPFDEVDRQMLEGLAASAGIALDNAQMLTERAEAEAALKAAKEQAEAANSAKDRFLATVSHELRTPLTPALAQVTAMEKDFRLPEETRAELRGIRQNVELESRLIDDLLDLTRVTGGKLEMKQEWVDVHELLRNAMEICRLEVESKQLHVSVELDAGHHHVKGDLGRLFQVFWNLVRNAVKFTPPRGQIGVRTHNRASGGPAAQDPPLVVAEVSDTGIGIDETTMPRIFEAFRRGGTGTRQFGGLGLGLAISKAIVDLHHGKLTARSAGPGRGATFVVELAAAPTSAPPAPQTVPAMEAKAKPMQILLVEDNVDTARVLGRLLRAMDHRVGVADRVETALKMLREQKYDLLISDIGLPDGTGLELMREVQRIRPTRAIAISGYGMEEDVRRSLAVGFREHLIKPITLEGLEAAIARAADA